MCLGFASSLLDWLYDHTEDGNVYQATYAPRTHSVELEELSYERARFLKTPLQPPQGP